MIYVKGVLPLPPPPFSSPPPPSPPSSSSISSSSPLLLLFFFLLPFPFEIELHSVASLVSSTPTSCFRLPSAEIPDEYHHPTFGVSICVCICVHICVCVCV